MIPYLHLGPLQLPTFGLMVALALITAGYVLQADFDRRGWKIDTPLTSWLPNIPMDASIMVTSAGVMGILGAKLYHVLESPAELLADPGNLLFSRFGFAWFGGFLAGFGGMLWMGVRAKLPLWEFLDACSPAASFGYAIGRIGCFLSGDGDYGKPTSLPWGMSFPNGVVPTTERVHPAPLYELLIWSAIGWLLWRLGERFLKNPGRVGQIFCYYLILTGGARFLVEIIRINPPWIFGLSNAQVASVASMIAGCVLLLKFKLALAASR